MFIQVICINVIKDTQGKTFISTYIQEDIIRITAVSHLSPAMRGRICPRKRRPEEHFRIFIDLPGEG
ncbi:hypothetical protein X777_16181 [Ooceraea biroi]|uniref:Uncharacterized protein n=1 Tax=Ooceraea biroi TaxID=2015173 RepID=A0A026WVG7_OOCBI|nr:hypothetical protein X777_16181 [Ooceraea biroi]